MKIALLLSVHNDLDLVYDTLESIFKYVTEDVLLLIDGASSEEFKEAPFPVPKIIGYKHGVPKSPYKNMALGLKTIREQIPDADWYCYTEADCFWASDVFKKSLKKAEEQKVWLLGTNGRIDHVQMPLVESLINGKFKSAYYMLGALMFFNKDYMNKLEEINFFDKFLSLTSGFESGYFPQYEGYDINEHMYSTMARHFGGNIGVFSTFMEGEWHGNYKQYPIRWKPELDPETEDFEEAVILHPIKKADHPIRLKHKEKRSVV